MGFVRSCLYSAVRLTWVREWQFMHIIYYYYYGPVAFIPSDPRECALTTKRMLGADGEKADAGWFRQGC